MRSCLCQSEKRWRCLYRHLCQKPESKLQNCYAPEIDSGAIRLRACAILISPFSFYLCDQGACVSIQCRRGDSSEMEMTQLEFFVTVVEEGSFSKAAERVYRTQPAVSIAIRRLDEEIGAPLLERSQKMPTLTEAGELVYDYAKRILALRDQV